MKKILSLILILNSFTILSNATHHRLFTHEQLGWYNIFSTIDVSDKVGIHSEYQWRRDNLITDGQQNLLRLGINYSTHPSVQLRAGYALIETQAYGAIPLNGFGKDFTEHRTFQMVQLSHKEKSIDLSHRFMLEQRFIGRYETAQESVESSFPMTNRMRYMFRMQFPIKISQKTDKPYIAFYDEIAINFGKNVQANVFDQNRIGILLGYSVHKAIRLEGGYFNQTVQFGRLIEDKFAFQSNNGFILNAHLRFNLKKNKLTKQS